MTDQQFQYLMRLYGGGNVASGNPAASNPMQYGVNQINDTDPSIEPSPLPLSGGYLPYHSGIPVPPGVYQGPSNPPNVPHQAMDFYPGNVSPGELGNPPSTIGPQVQAPGGQNPLGPGTINDQITLPRGGYPDIWNQPSTIGDNLPPSPGFSPSDYYLPNDYGPATVMSPPPPPFDFAGGPDIFGQVPTTPFSPTGQGAYDFSGGPNLFTGSPTAPMVGTMPGTFNPPTNEGMLPTSFGGNTPTGGTININGVDVSLADNSGGFGGPYFTPSDMYDYPATPGVPLTQGEPDFGGFPTGGGEPAANIAPGYAQTEGDPDFGGTLIDTSGISLNQPLEWETSNDAYAPPGADVGPGVPVNPMTGAQASGGVPYGYPGPGIGGPNQPGPWVPNNPAPWYPGRPDMTWNADNSAIYGPTPGGGFKPGQFFKDAAGNIIDGTGKMISSAADFAGRFGGSIANLARSIPGALRTAGEGFVDSLPKDSGGWGQPMGYFGIPDPAIPGTFGVNAPGVNRPGAGWAGTGITYNDVAASGVSPTYGNFAPGQVGRSSVPAPASLMPPSTGSGNMFGDLWSGAIGKENLRHIYKGIYTDPGVYGQMVSGAPLPGRGGGVAPAATFQDFHQGQVDLHNILTQNPAFYQAALGMGLGNASGTGGRGNPSMARTSRGTPPNQPV